MGSETTFITKGLWYSCGREVLKDFCVYHAGRFKQKAVLTATLCLYYRQQRVNRKLGSLAGLELSLSKP